MTPQVSEFSSYVFSPHNHIITLNTAELPDSIKAALDSAVMSGKRHKFYGHPRSKYMSQTRATSKTGTEKFISQVTTSYNPVSKKERSSRSNFSDRMGMMSQYNSSPAKEGSTTKYNIRLDQTLVQSKDTT